MLPYNSRAPEFDVSELETLFSATVPKSDTAGGKSGGRRKSTGSKPEKIHLVMLYEPSNQFQLRITVWGQQVMNYRGMRTPEYLHICFGIMMIYLILLVNYGSQINSDLKIQLIVSAIYDVCGNHELEI